MRNINFLIVLFFLTSCSSKEFIQWTSTTNEKSWQLEDPVEVLKFAEDSVYDIVLKSTDTQQTIDGFGVCFNELGWDALNLLERKMQDSILSAFFTPGKGFNLNICRMPIGANDYARDWYSLNDTPNDFEMENFNIDREKTTLIPYIKRAMEYNPDLKIWGSPWCPPVWMKTNNHYACRPDVVNDLEEAGRGKEGTTQFIMKKEYLKAYALYFSKYIETYRNEGIQVYAVHVQNEPNSCQNFPSCIWTANALNTFIGEYLGPELDAKFPDLELWYGTIERPYIENVDTVLLDEKSSKYIDGIGFQWAGKKAIPLVHDKYPEMKLMQTESECGYGANDWKAAEYTWSLIKHYMENGTSSYMYWNPILNETGKSQWGWKQNSLITVDTESRKATCNPEYYIFKHLTHFVGAGSKKLKTPLDKNVLAYLTPENDVVVLYVNINDEDEKVSLLIDGKSVTMTFKPKSFNTFVLSI